MVASLLAAEAFLLPSDVVSHQTYNKTTFITPPIYVIESIIARGSLSKVCVTSLSSSEHHIFQLELIDQTRLKIFIQAAKIVRWLAESFSGCTDIYNWKLSDNFLSKNVKWFWLSRKFFDCKKLLRHFVVFMKTLMKVVVGRRTIAWNEQVVWLTWTLLDGIMETRFYWIFYQRRQPIDWWWFTILIISFDGNRNFFSATIHAKRWSIFPLEKALLWSLKAIIQLNSVTDSAAALLRCLTHFSGFTGNRNRAQIIIDSLTQRAHSNLQFLSRLWIESTDWMNCFLNVWNREDSYLTSQSRGGQWSIYVGWSNLILIFPVLSII